MLMSISHMRAAVGQQPRLAATTRFHLAENASRWLSLLSSSSSSSFGVCTTTHQRNYCSKKYNCANNHMYSATTTRTMMTSAMNTTTSTTSTTTTPPSTGPQQQEKSRITLALTRQVPTTVTQGLTKYFAATDDGPTGTNSSSDMLLNFDTAYQQHANYVTELRQLVPTLQLPSLEEHPDCLFVEDTVVAIGNHAVVCHPGHVTRQGEVDSIRDILVQLGMTVTDMRDYKTTMTDNTTDDQAYCDGGDVLWTGRHLFVGLSTRTNQQAINVFETAFNKKHISSSSPPPPDEQKQQQQQQCEYYDIIPIPIPQYNNQALHLKSIVTHIDDTTLIAPIGQLGDDILETMEVVERGYTVIRLPNILACNVVVVNDTILVQDGGCPTSRNILETVAQEKQLQLKWVPNSELSKIDAALTCCSVLLSL